MPRLLLSCALVATLLTDPVGAQTATVASPNGANRVTFSLHAGVPTYSVDRFTTSVIEPSRLGFELQGLPPLTGDRAPR